MVNQHSLLLGVIPITITFKCWNVWIIRLLCRTNLLMFVFTTWWSVLRHLCYPLFIWGSLQCRVLVRPSPLDPECWAPHAYVAPPCWLAFLVFPLEKNNVWVHVGFACWLQVFEYGMCIWQSWERLPRLISFPISNSPLPFLPKVFSCLIKTLYTTTISKGNINALTLPIKDTNWEVID